jgi:hypothetical protein
MSLHGILQELLQRREQLEANLQLQYGRYDRSSRLPFFKKTVTDAPSLTLRSSPSHGNHVHLLKAKRDRKRISEDPKFIGIAESGTTKSFFYQVNLRSPCLPSQF